VWRLGDAVAPALALGLAIGRIGCFLNACCYGRPTHSHVGVVFPALHDGIPRHPTQLYDLAFNLTIMALLIGPLKRFKRKDGDLMAFWLILSGITRFIMEQYRRGETAIVWYWGFTMGQWLCMAMILGGILLYSLKWKKQAEVPDEA
jgi:phosphatidylglycerol:prolipoprotein diacylglycerol transferase